MYQNPQLDCLYIRFYWDAYLDNDDDDDDDGDEKNNKLIAYIGFGFISPGLSQHICCSQEFKEFMIDYLFKRDFEVYLAIFCLKVIHVL